MGGDVGEYDPTQDVDGRTAPVCAKLVTELAGQMVSTVSDAGGSGAE